MLRSHNLYCSDCLRTQRFLDLGRHLICEVCSKRLERIDPLRQTGNVVVNISDRSDDGWRRAG